MAVCEKVVMVDGREWHMKANALVPRMYRYKFGRDMMTDLIKLDKRLKEVQKAKLSGDEKNIAEFEATDLTTFENVAWCFIKAAGVEDVGNDPDEWLMNLDGMFSIYEILPDIIDLWTSGNATTAEPRKK